MMWKASLLLALGAAGCGLSPNESDDDMEKEEALGVSELGLTAGPFTITLSDDNLTMGLDDFAGLFIQIDPLDGFTGNVTLDATAEPPFPGNVDVFPGVVSPPDFAFLDISTGCDTLPGDYTVTVTGTGDDGTTASAALLLTVVATDFPPFASFFADREGFTVEFFDSSSAGGCGFGAEIVERLWDFGDGTTSTEENPVHTYAARGDYTVTLTVTNDEGLSDDTSETLTVLPPPPVLSIFRITRNPERFEFRVDLRWSGAEGELVELHRNFDVVDLPDNDGAHRDRFRSLETEFRWQICELGISFCSNEVSVDIGPSLSDNLATVTTEVNGQKIVETLVIEDERD